MTYIRIRIYTINQHPGPTDAGFDQQNCINLIIAGTVHVFNNKYTVYQLQSMVREQKLN